MMALGLPSTITKKLNKTKDLGGFWGLLWGWQPLERRAGRTSRNLLFLVAYRDVERTLVEFSI
jgi:hypothetical protein